MQIILANGLSAIIDDDDFNIVSQYSWHMQSKGYAASNKRHLMHRIIMRAKSGQMIDHINGNKLDNRKSNLRLCTNSQNHMNKPKTSIKKTSKYKGVYWCSAKKTWRSDIKINRKKIHIGSFKNEDLAAIAYNKVAKELHGDFALLNKILNGAIQ